MTYFIWLGCFAALTAHCSMNMSDPWLVKMDVTVRVVDEEGEPVPGSQVTASFRHTDKQYEQSGEWLKKFTELYEGDEAVSFSYTGDQNVAVWVEKEGYWTSGFRHKFPPGEDRIDGGDGLHGHYKKDFEIVLRKKKNPRPLYVHRVEWIQMPGYDHPYGFDLEKCDWVTPHGKGVHSDFIFFVTHKPAKHPEFWGKMKISFDHENDGLIEVTEASLKYSRLHLDQNAPEGTYIPMYERTKGMEKENSKYKDLYIPSEAYLKSVDGYWFRTRTIEASDGEIISRYGKIVGYFGFEFRDEQKPLINFTYYFSPDNSRSLEWNGESLVPKANLQGVDTY